MMKQRKSEKKSFMIVMNCAVVAIVVIVALSISSLFFYQMYRDNDQRAMNGLKSNLDQIDQSLTRKIESLYNVTNQLSGDVQLGLAVENYFSSDLDNSVQGKKMINYILNNAMNLSTDVENIMLLCDGRVLQCDRYSMDKVNSLSNMKDDAWYGQLLRDEIPWAFGVNTEYVNTKNGQQYFFCATKFKNKFYLDRKDESRIVVVTFRFQSEAEWIEDLAKQYRINFLLFNGTDNRMICKAGVDQNFHDLSADWGPYIGRLEPLEDRFITLSEANSLSGWQLLGFVERSNYTAMVYPVQRGLSVLLSLLLLVDILLSVTVVKNVTKPLRKVIKGMEDIGNQDFYRLDDSGQYREIDQLVRTFNQMSARIQDLIGSIAREERAKRREEFRALENQINPHFIYNTLDATRWVALMNNDKAAAEIIGSMSSLFRISLSGGKEMIPVRQEIELTKEYANIMVFRNNYIVELSYEADEETLGLMTLKMVLQPLVENCFVHAFEDRWQGARIWIRCFRRGNDLVMTVRDNGRGMKDRQAKPEAHDPVLSGIGMHNIDERLRLWYGSEYGLTIESPEDGGTLVAITQPQMRGGEGDGDDTSHAD